MATAAAPPPPGYAFFVPLLCVLKASKQQNIPRNCGTGYNGLDPDDDNGGILGLDRNDFVSEVLQMRCTGESGR